MSIYTKRMVATSAASQLLFSSFSTLGTSTSATFNNPVVVYLTAGTNRIFIGGSSAVTSASGYLFSSASSTRFDCRQGDELWLITSAAVNSTATVLLTNQPT